ncbi:MAG TPA: carbohydrate ABC transporter permease, partial [Spirochaetia bacterium]|nr:carbohydrate ABC transporter permease [Spirochaetia bacterium]
MKDRRLTPTDIIAKTGKWFLLMFFLFITFVPLLWLVISSFKTNIELQTKPFNLPAVWQFSNYVEAIRISGLPQLFLHSIIIALSATFLNLLVTSMGAFAFSREKFRFQGALLNLMLAGVLVPIIAFMVPYFKLIGALKIYDTLWGLILTYSGINIPISMFLVTGFMRSIPAELEEAGVMDGCNFWQRYTRIVMPLSKIGLVTAGTFVFLYAWNEFIYALLLTSSMKARTLQLGIQFFKSQFVTDYTSMFAAITLTI